MNKRGSALLMTVLILASITIVALNAANIVLAGVKMSGVQERSTMAFFAAEAGAECALYHARVLEDIPSIGQDDLYTTTLSNGSYYAVKYATSSSLVEFTSQGVFNETTRSIYVSY